MKVAILIPGKLREIHNVKRLYEDCDVFIHSDEKYLKDDYGRYKLDGNGERTLNPDYDKGKTYIAREDRKEWEVVGLMGNLRMKKGQKTGTNWIKMRDVSDTVEEWLVR